MIFQLFNNFGSDPLGAVISLVSFIIALVVGISVHEFSHAFSAYRLGDNTAKNLGRLTLNPKAHMDPLGTLMIVVAGFGWGKPTPVSPWNLRIGEKAGMAVVSIAGPISNMVLALLAALPIRLGLLSGGPDIVAELLGALILWNLVLAAFNLLPIAPLDGFKIVLGLLPREMAVPFAKTERLGPMILMLLIMSGFVLPIGLLGLVISPIIRFLHALVLGY